MPEIRQVLVQPLAADAQPVTAQALKNIVLRHRIRRVVVGPDWMVPSGLELELQRAASTRSADFLAQLGPGANLLLVAADQAQELIRRCGETALPCVLLPA